MVELILGTHVLRTVGDDNGRRRTAHQDSVDVSMTGRRIA